MAQEQTGWGKTSPGGWGRGRGRYGLQAPAIGGLNRHVECQRSSGDNIYRQRRLKRLGDVRAERKPAGGGAADGPGGRHRQIRRANQIYWATESIIRNNLQLKGRET